MPHANRAVLGLAAPPAAVVLPAVGAIALYGLARRIPVRDERHLSRRPAAVGVRPAGRRDRGDRVHGQGLDRRDSPPPPKSGGTSAAAGSAWATRSRRSPRGWSSCSCSSRRARRSPPRSATSRGAGSPIGMGAVHRTEIAPAAPRRCSTPRSRPTPCVGRALGRRRSGVRPYVLALAAARPCSCCCAATRAGSGPGRACSPSSTSASGSSSSAFFFAPAALLLGAAAALAAGTRRAPRSARIDDRRRGHTRAVAPVITPARRSAAMPSCASSRELNESRISFAPPPST